MDTGGPDATRGATQTVWRFAVIIRDLLCSAFLRKCPMAPDPLRPDIVLLVTYASVDTTDATKAPGYTTRDKKSGCFSFHTLYTLIQILKICFYGRRRATDAILPSSPRLEALSSISLHRSM